MFSSADTPVCHIVGAGQFEERFFRPKEGDYIIAADAGYLHLQKIDRVPDLVLGDFDSMTSRPEHPNVVALPREKDDTDTLYAVKLGLKKGFRQFMLHGVLGGTRIDHTLANLQTLVYLALHKAEGVAFGADGTVISVLHNSSVTFSGTQKGFLSVFCMGDRAEGVTLTGLKYPLEDAVLTCGMPLGVSNEFIGMQASVSVKNGILLLVWREQM